MDEPMRQYLNILEQKLDALTKMLEATKRLEINGEGDEDQIMQQVEFFSSLYEQRADIFSKIEKLDESLAQFEKFEENSEFNKLHETVLAKISDVAKAMVALDKEHIEMSKKLTAFLRGNLKKIRDGRDVNSAYSGGSENSTSGYYFNRTN